MTLHELVRAAMKEDMPNGDVTTESLALPPRPGRARLRAKEDIVLSGSAAFELSMTSLEPNARVKWHFEEGEEILKSQIICTIEGDLIQILKAERVALNFLGHLSGIATHTRRFVKAIEGSATKILDTRKTIPAYRDLQKRAVVHGGGVNHRMNLSTAVLIKDNHIAVMGGLTAAVNRVREHCNLPIEVEASTLEQVREAVAVQAQRILLDNMNNDMLREALKLIPRGVETEASGNMSLERVRSVAEIGVTYISVGALTHSAPNADVSLEFLWE